MELRTASPDLRPAIYLEDVDGAQFERVKASPSAGETMFLLKGVRGFSTRSCPGVANTDRADVAGPEHL